MNSIRTPDPFRASFTVGEPIIATEIYIEKLDEDDEDYVSISRRRSPRLRLASSIRDAASQTSAMKLKFHSRECFGGGSLRNTNTDADDLQSCGVIVNRQKDFLDQGLQL